MINRRSFIGKTTAAVAGMLMVKFSFANKALIAETDLPIVISTWKHGLAANECAWTILSSDGWSLNAVEDGVRIVEDDPNARVGYGGFPDEKGKVTLDACIMDEKGRAGSVSFLQHIKHPVSVARQIMEKTPYAMLSGKGALKFALENGFEKEKLLTKEQKRKWKNWRKENRNLLHNISGENHDTIGMLALDSEGRISGACTTSGLAYKMHGRVGESPIIGAGLFIDGEVGGAVATGTGELVMKTLGSFLIVEMMRNGLSPNAACEEAIKRIAQKIPEYQNHQVGFLALNISGEYGSHSIQPGFDFAVKTESKSGLEEAESWLKKL